MKSIEALIEGLKEAKEELEKAIKPGPTLDYSKINQKPDRAAQEAAAPTINYGGNRMTAPTWTGAAANAAAVRSKLDNEAKETALQTISRRQQMNKLETQPMSIEDDPNSLEMSEEEPHKDDPYHEAKEKNIGKKIKEEAQDLLDMHKAGSEIIKAHSNGQWMLEKDNSVKPFGTSVYNSTANLGRKMSRTGEVREGAGRNNAVRSYTTSGSSIQATHEANEAKEQKAKTKASTKTLADMTPEEKAKLESQYGAKIKK